MSEEATAAALEAAAATPPPAAAPEPAPAPAAAEPEGDWKSDPAKVEAYIKELRDEAAANRVKAKPYVEVFDGYSQQETTYLLDVLRAARSDNEADRLRAGEEFKFLAQQMGVTIAEAVEAAATAAGETVSEEAPAPASTPSISAEEVNAQIRAALDEQNRAREVEAEVKRIQSTIKDAGYEPFSPDYFAVVGVAKSQGLSIEDALAKYKEAEQAKIDAFVSGQRGAGSRFPTQSGSSATPPPGGGEKPDWVGDTAKTSQAVRDFFRSRAGQS